MWGKQKHHKTIEKLGGEEGGGGGGGRDGLGVRESHVHTEVYGMMDNGDLLYSTENSTQYSMIIYVGKNQKENGCVYKCNSITLLYSRNYQNIVNKLCFNKTLKNEKKKSFSFLSLIFVEVGLQGLGPKEEGSQGRQYPCQG